MNSDLISRSELKEVLRKRQWYIDDIEEVEKIIDNAPTVETPTIYEFKGCDNCELERPKGEWINPYLSSTTGEFSARCNICGEDIMTSLHHNFCPNCGADMRKPNCVRCDHFGKDCNKCEKGEE